MMTATSIADCDDIVASLDENHQLPCKKREKR